MTTQVDLTWLFGRWSRRADRARALSAAAVEDCEAQARHIAKLWCLAACAVVLVAAVPQPALAAPSGSTHAMPGNGVAGVTRVCGPSAAYACTTASYAGKSTEWWGAKYGAGYASSNAYGYHNCTLYAAFRVAQNGLADPGWSNNANGWDTSAFAKGTPVDQSAALGAVAQWNGGSAGHVAYVETVGNGFIEVTEDNYGLNVTNRWRIASTSPAWPDNFVHLRDQAAPGPSSRKPDFTGDGKADLLYMDPGSTIMRLLSSTGTGLVGPSSWASGMGQPAWQAAGDFSGDGKTDLVYQDASSTDIRVLTSGGSQTSGNSVWAAGMGMSAWRVAGDFTGDGKADLLYMDPGSTIMRLLSSTGTGLVGPSSWASGMGQPAWQAAGDFSGDGKTDLVYQDANSTDIRVLTSGGSQTSGNSVWAAGMGMSAWRVAG